MSWQFPRLARPSVFIAAPGDLAYLREAASLEFDSLRDQAADDHGLELYRWELDKAEDGFDDWIPAQGQIPLPSDENCRAVVCMLGERIGTPLAPDFDTSPLGPLSDIEGGGARLVHPWEEGADADGGFALTGTVFEYLAALRANAHNLVRPVKLLLVGDDTIRSKVNPLHASWGGCRLRDEAKKRFRKAYPEGEEWEDAFFEWRERHYRPQIRQLGNFLRYLNHRHNTFPDIVDNEVQARRLIRDFLSRSLDLRVEKSQRDPFKGLEPYAREDAEVFFGREAERKEAVSELTRLWADASRPTFYGVVGGSGVGKSSMARAALVGHLCHHTSDGRYLGCIVRPTDLLVPVLADGASMPLLSLYRLALAAVDAGTDQATESAVLLGTESAQRPALVVQRLAQALERRGGNWRLLLTFDQFEELLDQRQGPDGAALWGPVIELIQQAAAHPAMGVVYTLQTNREELIDLDPVLGRLWARGFSLRLNFPEHGLDDIIRKPFRIGAGIELEPELVQALRDNILQFMRDESRGSLLPLVSLTLQRIYNQCAPVVLARSAQANEAQAGNGDGAACNETTVSTASDTEQAPLLRLGDCGGLLHITSAIAELADRAVREARDAAGAAWSDDTTVGNLLRRLVRMGTSDRRLALPVAAMPAEGPLRRLAEALMKNRLLLPEVGGGIKLVHEAVFDHWPAANAWLKGEWRLLRMADVVRSRAERWDESGRASEALQRLSDVDLDEAAELIAQWTDVLLDDEPSARDRLLRDYALALMRARPEPRRVVEALSSKGRHVHIAAGYGDVGLLQHYIALDPACVHEPRGDLRTPLFNACGYCQLGTVELLLQAGAHHDVLDDEQWQAIHLAAGQGHTRVVERLVQAGASPWQIGGEWHATPMHLAAQNGHVDVVAWLLARPDCDTAVTSRYGWTPLHFAAYHGHAPVVERLLAANPVTIPARLFNDMTPLHLAALEGKPSVVRALVAAGASLDARAKNDWADEAGLAKRKGDQPWLRCDWTALHLAVNAGHEAAAIELLEGGADVNAATDEGRTALMMAVAAGHRSLVATLLRYAPDFTLRDNSKRAALHLALESKQYELAEQLVGAGGDVDLAMPGRDETPLHDALRGGDVERARFLLQMGASTTAPTPGGFAPVHLAVHLGKLPMLQLLVERGVPLAQVDGRGRTALHLAAEAESDAALAWLLQYPGLELNAVDQDGLGALHLAARAGRLSHVMALLGAGAMPDARDADGWTPLLLAAQGGHDQVVQALLLAGADAHALAERPQVQAIQLAAEGGHAQIVLQLLAAGVSVEVQTADKATPLVLAVRNAQFDTAHTLLEHGAAVRGPMHEPGELIALTRSHQRQRAAYGLPIPMASARLVTRVRTLAGVGDGQAPEDKSMPRRTVVLPLGRLLAGLDIGTIDASDSRDSGVVRGLMHYPWRPAQSEWLAHLQAEVRVVDGRLPIDPASTRVDVVTLPWYGDRPLLRLTDPAWQPASLAIYYLASESAPPCALHRLNGTSPPIHAFNESAPLQMDEYTVLGYLRFFCFFVRGVEGPFHFLETPDDPLIAADTPAHVLAVIRNTVQPATFDGRDENGSFLCSGVVWYGNALFVALFVVRGDGNIEMLNDEPIAADLPIHPDAPLA